MAAIPPSYEEAISADPWTIVAPYLPHEARALCNASLVCRRWHQAFTPYLWGNPMSKFEAEYVSVYDGFLRFKRTLTYARLCVRQMTHTLQLPPEVYVMPSSDWLLAVFERLPSLRCLLVDGLQYFAHDALSHLGTPDSGALGRPNCYGLRLLSASGCTYASSTGLCEALKHLPRLIYLNLSGCAGANHGDVFTSLRFLFDLKVLFMGELELTDNSMARIVDSCQHRLRSLDVRNNLLTDVSVIHLLRTCLDPIEGRNSSMPMSCGAQNNSAVFNLARQVRDALVSGYAGTLPVEMNQSGRITHLYLSDNHVTVKGVAELFKSAQLSVLDCGDLTGRPGLSRVEYSKSHDIKSGLIDLEYGLASPAIRHIRWTFGQHAVSNLTYLRIHHAFVTTPSKQYGMGHDDICRPSALRHTSVERAPVATKTAAAETVRSPDSANTKKADTNTSSIDPPSYNDATHATSSAHTSSAIESEEIATQRVLLEGYARKKREHDTGVPDVDPCTVLVNKREDRLRKQLEISPHITPLMLPTLQTLVLCGIPEYSKTRGGIDQYCISFIHQCAGETARAREEARLNYACPPGQTRRAFERDYVRSIFALQLIVLEIGPEVAQGPSLIPNLGKAWRSSTTKQSSTEDADSEALWQAAQDDFSFFGSTDDGESTNLPSRPRPTQTTHRVTNGVDEIAAYRKQKRLRYQQELDLGVLEPQVDGYWDGDVQVRRL